ncbi:hypothetical protein A2U01_0113817, partial [Trifolium medium]|nr:hypothetical protein [Trifolium medium]
MCPALLWSLSEEPATRLRTFSIHWRAMASTGDSLAQRRHRSL